MGARSNATARALAALRAREADRRVRDSVRAAGALGSLLVRALVRARGDSPAAAALVVAWGRDLRALLVEASLRSHLQASVDAVNEAAAVLAPRRRLRLFARPALYGAQDPTSRAVQFLRSRLVLEAADLEALRDTYGRVATDIVLPLQQTASASVQEALAGVVEQNLARRGAERVLSEALAGVAGVRPATVETLFRTQHQMAYSAGAYVADQDAAVQEILWGYEYVTVGDDRVRDNHRALDGVKLPKDDERWGRLRPPNGYNCRCQILRVFDTDAHDVVEPGPVDINGAPVVPSADPGFNFNPGLVYRDALAVQRRALREGRLGKPAAPPAAPAPAPAPAPKPEPKPEPRRLLDDQGWPVGLDVVEDVEAAGGSTGARVVRAGDARFVMKKGTSAEHLLEEAAALDAYRAAGVAVPESRVVIGPDGRPVLLTKWVEGRPLSSLKGDEKKAALAAVQKDFAVDALLGNWDVAGLSLDNVIVRPDGTPVRIDVGGSLRFRARGEPKGEAFGAYPGELWSLRDPGVNAASASVFSGLGWDGVVPQIDALAAREKALMAALPEPLRGTVRARLREMQEVADVSRPMLADEWRPAYVERVGLHTAGLRRDGFSAALPKEMHASSWSEQRIDPADKDKAYAWGGVLRDENGQEWDNLRGRENGSATDRMFRYIEGSVGREEARRVRQYHAAQASNSWSSGAARVKRVWAEQRGGNVDERYYWHRQHQSSRWGDPPSADALAALQAANMQVLRNVAMPNVDREGGRCWLVRTETISVLQHYGVTQKGQVATMQRGPAESFSLLRPVYVDGDAATYQYVPFHRVLTGYWWGSSSTRNVPGSSWLHGDAENELVCMADGIPSLLVSQSQRGRGFMAAPGGPWPPAGGGARKRPARRRA